MCLGWWRGEISERVDGVGALVFEIFGAGYAVVTAWVGLAFWFWGGLGWSLSLGFEIED